MVASLPYRQLEWKVPESLAACAVGARSQGHRLTAAENAGQCCALPDGVWDPFSTTPAARGCKMRTRQEVDEAG